MRLNTATTAGPQRHPGGLTWPRMCESGCMHAEGSHWLRAQSEVHLDRWCDVRLNNRCFIFCGAHAWRQVLYWCPLVHCSQARLLPAMPQICAWASAFSSASSGQQYNFWSPRSVLTLPPALQGGGQPQGTQGRPCAMPAVFTYRRMAPSAT